jgi:hypothetical protein
MPLPLVEVESGRVRSSTLALYRGPSVLLQMDRTDGLIDVEKPPVEPFDEELGRLVGYYRVEQSQLIRPVLTLEPNRPRMHAEQVTRLRFRDSVWYADIDCRVEVKDGLLDRIRIDAPSPWDGPYQLEADPPATIKVFRAPDGSRQLVVQPTTAIDGKCRFSISSPLTFHSGDRPSVPQVVLREAGPMRRFIVLPKRIDSRPVAWETKGLKRSELPDVLRAGISSGETVAYEVVGKPDGVTLRAPGDRRTDARVRLADFHVNWSADGTCRGVATFDLEPGQATECPLWLPAEYRLVQVVIAGLPTPPISTGKNRWQVPLGPDRLPQRVEVLFCGELAEAGSAGRQSFDAPALGTLPVEQTLWSVSGPPLYEPAQQAAHGQIRPWSQELARCQSTSALIKSGTILPDENPEETRRWYRVWIRRFTTQRSAVKRQLAQADSAADRKGVETQLHQLDQQQWRVAQRLGTTTMLAEQLAAGVSVAEEVSEVGQWWLDRQQPAARYVFDKAAGSITVPYRRAEAGQLSYRVAWATGLLGVIVLGVIGYRRGMWCELLKRWPHTMGVAVGLAWWLWLWPSALGWVIVLASVLASFYAGWKQTRPRPVSSIVTLEPLQR